MRTRIAFAIIPAIAVSALLPTVAYAIEPGEEIRAAALFAELPVAPPVTSGYNRDLFEHWIDEDGNGCNTRQEVLIAESEVEPTITAPCTVTAGQWYSWYDGATWTSPADVEIDHVVALSEAWKSGANAWTPEQRRQFANDLAIDESLDAVTGAVNSAKGDSDPAAWLPPLAETHCEYAIEWAVVKYRWHLNIDPAEQSALNSLLSGDCGATTLLAPERINTSDVPAPSSTDELQAGEVLGSGTDMVAIDGSFRLTMQTDGNAVVYTADNTPIWNSRSFAPGSRLVMQGDGNAVVLTPDDRPNWNSRTFGNTGAKLRMQADGNLVIYRANGTAAWNSFEDPGRVIKRPPSSITAGTQLTPGTQLQSENDLCRAVMQGDGNFVVYGPRGVNWNSRTGTPGSYLEVQTDGNMVVYTPNRGPAFFTGTSGAGPVRLVMQGDCNLVLYRADDVPVWDSISASRPVAPPPPVVTPPGPTRPGNPGDTKNCSDFRTQAEAQAWFNYYYPYYGDIANLDGDGNLRACESLR